MPEPRFTMPEPAPRRRLAASAVALSRSRFHPTELATYVFLASLGILFIASLIPYVLIRMDGLGVSSTSTISLPWTLWLSTGALFATSVALARALFFVRHERQFAMRQALLVSGVLGTTFVAIQSLSLEQIRQQHFVAIADRVSLYGIVFFLVLLHALHVVGGLVCLVFVTIRGFTGAYDHECYRGLKLCTLYWHFLDVVWIVILATFLLTAWPTTG